MIKLLYIDNFFDNPTGIYSVVENLQFVPKKFGEEIENFNMINPELIDTFKDVLNTTDIVLDEEHSGVFRRPIVNIHFEDFKTPFDWCFTVALKETMFQLYKHNSGAETALENPNLNSINFLDWDCIASVHLRPNQCVFFRPWLYHSFLGGMTQHYIINGINTIVHNELMQTPCV